MKEAYVIQPYKVGSKKGNSLAVILPADITRQYNINPSTVFVLRVDGKTRHIMLQRFEMDKNRENTTMMRATPGQNLEISSQQMRSPRVELVEGDLHR